MAHSVYRHLDLENIFVGFVVCLLLLLKARMNNFDNREIHQKCTDAFTLSVLFCSLTSITREAQACGSGHSQRRQS